MQEEGQEEVQHDDFSSPDNNPRHIPKGRSIAHQSIANEKAVYMSFDIEVAGEAAGIIQISVVIVWMEMAAGGVVGKDRVEEVHWSPSTFNSYVCP